MSVAPTARSIVAQAILAKATPVCKIKINLLVAPMAQLLVLPATLAKTMVVFKTTLQSWLAVPMAIQAVMPITNVSAILAS